MIAKLGLVKNAFYDCGCHSNLCGVEGGSSL